MPFEEDDKDPSIWFLDHSYLENMFRMFKKVNGEGAAAAAQLQQLHNTQLLQDHRFCSCSLPPGTARQQPSLSPLVVHLKTVQDTSHITVTAERVSLTDVACRMLPAVVAVTAREHVVGWYSTGPRLREADLAIQQLMSNYVTTPVLVICEVEVGRDSGTSEALTAVTWPPCCSASHAVPAQLPLPMPGHASSCVTRSVVRCSSSSRAAGSRHKWDAPAVCLVHTPDEAPPHPPYPGKERTGYSIAQSCTKPTCLS